MKVEALGRVVRHTAATQVEIAQALRTVEQLAPEASARIAPILDAHTLVLQELFFDFGRTLRRL